MNKCSFCVPIIIMRNKILWLSIFGLVLGKPPNPIDSRFSKFDKDEQKQRNSRSIWPFTSSETTTTEAPENDSPLLSGNNEWFVQGETPLPQGIDLKKYPIWKIHKYNGIDLHPVNIQPHNYYPPEETIVDVGYPSGSSSFSPNFPPNSYLNGYQDFLKPRYEIHSAGYPPATYPPEKDDYRTGEYHSSTVTPGIGPYNIQTQQKHEVYFPPQPLTDFRSTVLPETQKIPQYNYGVSNVRQQIENADYHLQKQIQPTGQRQPLGNEEEQIGSVVQNESSDGKIPDLSLLDQLSALNSFYPGDEEENSESSSTNDESNNAQQGFFENLFSRFRGTTEAPLPTSDVVANENEESSNSGGFLSSMFGLRSEKTETPKVESSFNTKSSGYGNGFSSVFYQPEIEKPAAVLPTTYYLPKTRGSYITVKVPAKNPAPGLSPTLGPYEDLSHIAYHDISHVPFTQHEIPYESGSPLESGYHYNHPEYLDVRNAGLSGPTINADYLPIVGSGQPHPTFTSTGSESYPTRQQSSYQGSNYQVNQNFPPFSSTSNNAEPLDLPRAEYQHSLSVNKNQANGSPVYSSVQSSYYREGQLAGQSDHQLPINNLNALTSSSIDEFTKNRNQNSNTQSLNGADYQYQNFGTTDTKYQSQLNFGENVERGQEIIANDNRGNEPISNPQLSNDFIPVSPYGVPDKNNDESNYENGNKENNGQIISEDSFGDVSTQNFEAGNPVFNEDLVLPIQNEPSKDLNLPIYQSSISAFQRPTEPLNQEEINRFLPIKEAINFHQELNNNDEELKNNRLVEDVSSLTSFGTLTNSYETDPFAAASSNVKVITVYPSKTEKVDDSLDVNINKDAFRSTLPTEQLPETKKADRVLVQKVMKHKNLLEGNNNSQRSNPVRQATVQESDAPLIIKSENDSIPEIRGGRKFDENNIIVGYSKVQHPQHKNHRSDNDQAIKLMNSELEAVRK